MTTTTHIFNLSVIHHSWQVCIERGLSRLDPLYINTLSDDFDWLPGPENIFNAFSIPLEKVNYVLFGESPYPRKNSANGYAFWDAAVKDLWSETGLNKKVNRATSLRNIIKMLLIAEGFLDKSNTSQESIALLNKQNFVQTGNELFANFLHQGFLLLNTTLVLHERHPQKDAKQWRPFVEELLHCLAEHRPQAEFIFLGRIANSINPLIANLPIKRLYAEHPYNLSFQSNNKVLDFFRPLHLIMKRN